MSTMIFCRECNNILYPKEDRANKTLLYACRNCDHQEVAENNCVFRNELNLSVRAQILQDVTADPTLPRTRTVRCAQCSHEQAVFFQHSNNILYPKEDRDQKILLYACRNCDHQEVADNNCVYRNEIHHSVGERTQVLQDVAADPTLPRTKSVRCAQCNHGEAVFFQATARGEEGMTLFFVCCNPNCGHRWRD
ncbi:DNA-directed RNA polymerase II subunit [Morus notabilis]|uniref:DNA-directed RNA polymerase II subunit n=1 Tax=Morus notabilis TaxID=981085 RepID=W9QW59_9ROSA|nr:DNA-directed RNA polymerase II subunit [Morus notabilis]